MIANSVSEQSVYHQSREIKSRENVSVYFQESKKYPNTISVRMFASYAKRLDAFVTH